MIQISILSQLILESMKGNDVGATQAILNKVERHTMVGEIESKLKTHEEAMVDEMKEDVKSREEAIVDEMKKEFKSREEVIMSKIERMNEMEIKSKKSREENMMNKMEWMMEDSKEKSQSEIKILRLELMVVTLACIGISIVAYLSLRH